MSSSISHLEVHPALKTGRKVRGLREDRTSAIYPCQLYGDSLTTFRCLDSRGFEPASFYLQESPLYKIQ